MRNSDDRWCRFAMTCRKKAQKYSEIGLYEKAEAFLDKASDIFIRLAVSDRDRYMPLIAATQYEFSQLYKAVGLDSWADAFSTDALMAAINYAETDDYCAKIVNEFS